jgi:hypothetical protein
MCPPAAQVLPVGDEAQTIEGGNRRRSHSERLRLCPERTDLRRGLVSCRSGQPLTTPEFGINHGALAQEQSQTPALTLKPAPSSMAGSLKFRRFVLF